MIAKLYLCIVSVDVYYTAKLCVLQGFNLQLTSVLLSFGLYAYIESGTCTCTLHIYVIKSLISPAVFRKKLSRRLDACVLDRRCNKTGCEHRYKGGVWWVVLIKLGFILLNLFHLAYTGVMFDVTDEETGLQKQVYSHACV